MQTAAQVEHVDIPDFVSEPSRIVESERALAQIANTLRELHPSTREVFLLDRLQLWSHANIASRIGVTVSMVEKHMSYAMTAFEKSGFEQPRHCFGRRPKSRRRAGRLS
jgi:RNA polymerase sigma-70 factor (ECF subfamily)